MSIPLFIHQFLFFEIDFFFKNILSMDGYENYACMKHVVFIFPLRFLL